MIIATAGHVDHGKTALVKALTGTDTDTLEEEKRRGLTITPGFAYFDVNRVDGGTARIGFVDVPGHEQFIHNMLGGIAGIDAVLLVVAANEGVMPQTLEHLRIMDLLDVRHGIVVVTKTDRAGFERMANLYEELNELLRGTCMEHANIIRTSATTGEGIEELREELENLTAFLPEHHANGNFRMSVDRAFTLKGIGVIATGTVHAGRAESHEELVVAPAGTPARIRGIYSEDQPASAAVAGHRCALNLGGIELSQISRGDWLTSGEAARGTKRLDVRLAVPAIAAESIPHWMPVHVFHGASHVTGRVALLEGHDIEPGDNRLAQLVLDAPIVAVSGDRCILRNQASDETIAGATVIDIFTSKQRRPAQKRLAQLDRMQTAEAADCLQALVSGSPESVSLEEFRCNRNLTRAEADELFGKSGLVLIETGTERRGLDPDQWQTLLDAILSRVLDWHEKTPDVAGFPLNKLRAAIDPSPERPVMDAAIRELMRRGRIEQTGPFYHSPGFRRRPSDEDMELFEQLRRLISKAGDRPPTVLEMAESLQADSGAVAAALKNAAHAGLVVRVEPNRYFLPGHIKAMAQLLVELADEATDGLVTTAAYRDASGLGRNLAIAVLEYFDSEKITRRIGDTRRLTGKVD
jgi:selenocysteine-specific elongation factor